MGDRRVGSPPGICWSAYSDTALLESIKTITNELQARAVARASAASGSGGAASISEPTPALEGSNRPAIENAKEMEKPRQEWY